MISLDFPLPTDVIHRRGRVWSPNEELARSDEYSPDYFCQELVRYSNEIVESEVLWDACPNVYVHIAIFDNKEPNAFVEKIGNNERYLIGVNRGLIDKLADLFASSGFLKELRRMTTYLGGLSEADLIRYSIYMASATVVFHEFSHIYRGHINYVCERLEKRWDESIKSSTNRKSEKIREKIYRAECDADACAGALLAGEVRSQAKGLSSSLGNLDALDDIQVELALLSVATVYFFNLALEGESRATDFHPSADLRTAFVASHLCSGLSNGTDALGQVIIAFELIVQLSGAKNRRKGIDRLAVEVANWQKHHEPVLQEFGRTLVPFSPCKKANDRCQAREPRQTSLPHDRHLEYTKLSRATDPELQKYLSRNQLIYSLGGQFLGFASILGGIVLFLAGVTGAMSWTAKFLGAESTIADAAPGAVLFVVGLFMVFVTRYRFQHREEETENPDQKD